MAAIPLCALLIAVQSCEMVSKFVHGGKVVARVGAHKLYESEIDEYIPDNTSPEDSVRLALQYINTWASDILFADIAEKELTKEEKDVTKELEDYRHSLLKYRYEQKFINQRLDTAVSQAQIDKYYGAHPELFKLDIPIVRVRFMTIAQDSPNLGILKKKMSSGKPEDLLEADSLAYSSAQKYVDNSQSWMDVVTLAREFGTDYMTMLSSRQDGFIEMPNGNGNLNVAYIVEMMPSGVMGPVEYYKEMIKDIILSVRKRTLLNSLERDLIENARNQENFEIY